jgi:hypothetical protein
MASQSTSRLSVGEVRRLGLRSYDWLRVRLDLPVRSDNDRLLDAVYDGPVPIDALVEHDGKVGDLVGTLWAALFLMSNRFVQVLEQNAITGWRGYDSVMKGRGPTTAWRILGVTGRSGPVRTPTGGTAGLQPLGHYLDPQEWDGSDLFHPGSEGTILVTARAAEALEEAHLKNVVLEPAGLEPQPVGN